MFLLEKMSDLKKNNILAPLIVKINSAKKVKRLPLYILLAWCTLVYPQGTDVPPPPPPTTPQPEGSIDGGLVFLLLAGLSLGVYFLWRYRHASRA